MAIICPACDYENASDADFCEACGYELAGVSAGSPTPIPAPPETVFTAPTPPVDYSPAPVFTPPLPSPPVTPPIPTPPIPTTSTTARLICKQPGVSTPESYLDGSNVIIGKFDPDMGPVDIDLEGFPGDETISRNHGEIYLEGGVWKIKDLGSSNGIFLKRVGQSRYGARITTPEALNSGDEIAIAKIKFLFQSP